MAKVSLLAAAAALVSASAMGAAVTETIYTVTTGTYDENVVRTQAVTSSLTAYNLAAFTGDLATAYAAGRGAVLPFDRALSTQDSATFPTDTALLNGTQNRSARVGAVGADTYTGRLQAKYNGGNSMVTITNANSVYVPFAMGSATPISGMTTGTTTAYGALGDGDGADGSAKPFDLTFSFSSGEALSKVALTYIGRANSGLLTNNSIADITAYFTGGGNSTVSTNANNSNGQRFAAFAAPDGEYITRLVITPWTDSTRTTLVSNRQVMIDDLAFITAPVPEPTSLALLGAAGLLLGRRRKA